MTAACDKAVTVSPVTRQVPHFSRSRFGVPDGNGLSGTRHHPCPVKLRRTMSEAKGGPWYRSAPSWPCFMERPEYLDLVDQTMWEWIKNRLHSDAPA
jgi:hypothetical protein